MNARTGTSDSWAGGWAPAAIVALFVTGASGMPFEECPGDSSFSQPPAPPSGGWKASVSDSQYGTCWYEYFSVGQDICRVTAWGLMGYQHPETGWQPCVEQGTFLCIRIYDDDAGKPGALIRDFTTDWPQDTGYQYGVVPPYYPLYRFHFDLSQTRSGCCPQRTGWISVQGCVSTPDPQCWFFWMGSEAGDGTALFQDDEGLHLMEGWDFSLCLTGPEPEDMPGDADGDGDVDVDDLLTLLSSWGDCGGQACPADFDQSGSVDVLDLLILLGHWS